MKSRESLEPKFPEEGVLNPNVGIVLLNHVGSSSQQDAGRDAQFLANRFRTLTIAADRPTSYRLPRSRQLAEDLQYEPVQAMFGLAKRVDKLFDNWGLNKIIIMGRSAGGLGAMELAMTEGISGMSFLYAAEPVGCRNMTVADGEKRFADYAKEQKELQKADLGLPESARRLVHPRDDAKDLPLTAQLSRKATMVPLFLTDKHYNRRHWNQKLVPGYLSHLALDLGLQTHVDFAEHSLVLPTESAQRGAFLGDLISIAVESAENHRGKSSLSSVVVADTTHASFDRRDVIADRLAWTAGIQAGISLLPAA